MIIFLSYSMNNANLFIAKLKKKTSVLMNHYLSSHIPSIDVISDVWV